MDLYKAVHDDKLARSVPVVDTLTDEEKAYANRPSTGMALALTVRQTYEGTVPGAEKARRRQVGKRQRSARKIHRGNR